VWPQTLPNCTGKIIIDYNEALIVSVVNGVLRSNVRVLLEAGFYLNAQRPGALELAKKPTPVVVYWIWQPNRTLATRNQIFALFDGQKVS
jgi:hypothetical protein